MLYFLIKPRGINGRILIKPRGMKRHAPPRHRDGEGQIKLKQIFRCVSVSFLRLSFLLINVYIFIVSFYL